MRKNALTRKILDFFRGTLGARRADFAARTIACFNTLFLTLINSRSQDMHAEREFSGPDAR